MPENRRKVNYHPKLGGMSTGSLLTMLPLVLSLMAGSGVIYTLKADVKNNKEAIEKERVLSRQEKLDVTKQGQESEKRIREDIQVLTRIVVEKLK